MVEGRARTVARRVLALVFAVAGVFHLAAPEPMVRITPVWVPFPYVVVIVTGFCEFAGAAGLMTRRWRVAAGWALALYAVCVFPANVKHAIHDLGGHTGLGLGYHGPRLLLQPVIVWWALWASGTIDWPWSGRGRRVVPASRVP